MTNEELDDFLDLLRSKGWSVKLTESGGGNLNESFSGRYPRIPEAYAKSLRRVASCANAAETVWFFCADDYNGTSPAAFAWNEFETMGLEAAVGDEPESERIREFWDRYLPFMLSVRGDYACLSLCASGDAYGSVVDCYAPDFEGFTDVAATFDKFVRLYSAASKGISAIPYSAIMFEGRVVRNVENPILREILLLRSRQEFQPTEKTIHDEGHC